VCYGKLLGHPSAGAEVLQLQQQGSRAAVASWQEQVRHRAAPDSAGRSHHGIQGITKAASKTLLLNSLASNGSCMQLLLASVSD
jgi:hypothetical protein